MIETIFSLPESNFPVPLRLHCAGITHPDTHYRIRREKSLIYVLEYVISGTGHLRIDETPYTVKAGDVYLLQPYQRQEYFSDSADPWEKIWFNLSGPLIRHLIDSYELSDMVCFPDCPQENNFRSALETVRRREQDAYTGLALAVHRIFAGMNEWRQKHPETAKSTEGLKLKEYLDTNWRKEIPLEELALLIGRSRSQTIRIFRRDWNTTPIQYMQNQRYLLARKYLENTDSKIAEIAEAAGFKDEFYFSNWFKQKAGLAPAIYRRKFRK